MASRGRRPAGDGSSGRWQARPVLTGSMQPGFPVGSVALLERVPVRSLQVRDVILVGPPGEQGDEFIHRIISLVPARGGPIVRTQGDANAVADSWRLKITSPYAYEARLSLPFVGYVALAAHSPTGRRSGLGVAVALLLAAGVLALARRRKARVPRASHSIGADSRPAGITAASTDEPQERHPGLVVTRTGPADRSLPALHLSTTTLEPAGNAAEPRPYT
jgi:signal peptidase I